MELFILCVFILGYLGITLEHSLKVDKLVPSLLMMAFAWAGVSIGLDDFTMWFNSAAHELMDITGMASEEKSGLMQETLLHHLGKTSEILIFLIGAMTIVEIIDHFHGFSAIKGFIRTNKKKK